MAATAIFVFFFLLLHSLPLPSVEATMSMRLGVNYGQLGDNLPSHTRSVRLIHHLRGLRGVKIYDADAGTLAALSGTGLYVSVMIPNNLIPSIAANSSAADHWISSSILPFLPQTKIRFLLVGNEILSGSNSTWSFLVPAISNIHAALRRQGIRNIKLGTSFAMDTLSASFPPSSGEFRTDIAVPVVLPLLRFLRSTKSYLFLDLYTYFPWAAAASPNSSSPNSSSPNSSSIPIEYATFRATPSMYRRDPATGLIYTNLYDEMLDAVHVAMDRLGFRDVPIFVAETGWPNAGDLDQIGANAYNAARYNREIARRAAARSPEGTPARPGVRIPTFIFSLYDEDQKPGKGTERHWGLLYPNGSRIYEVDLTRRLPESEYPPLPPPENDKPYKGKIWCVMVPGKEENATAAAVGEAVAYACGQGNGTCDAIQPGGACFRPNTVAAHASYAFNSYWQQFRHAGGICYFGGLAVQTPVDPSHGSCKYLSSTS